MGGNNSAIEIRAATGHFSAAEFRTVAMDGDVKLFTKLMQNVKDAEASKEHWRNFDNWKAYFTWKRKEKQTEYTEEEKDKVWDLPTGPDTKPRQSKTSSSSTNKKKTNIVPVFDEPDADGCTALHHAAMSGAQEIVKMLIEEKVRKDLLDKWGRTPLWYAASMKRLDVVRYLIEANVDINKARVNDSGNKWIGRGGGGDDNMTFGETPLHRAAEKGHLDIVQALVKGNADLNNHGMDFWMCFGETPLHRAAANGRLDVVKFLIDAGCDMDRQDADGNTALHRASYRGRLPCVQYLVEMGAAMDDMHLNSLRETPLTTAARGNVPATSWYLSSVKPEMQLAFKAKRLEREEKLGLGKKDVLADTPLVDVSVHTLAKSRHPGAVGGGSIGNGPPRRRMGSLVAQGFGGGDSSEEMVLVQQTNNNVNGSDSGSDVAAMQSLDVFAAAAVAGVNSSSSSKSLKAITEGDETAAADIIDNDNDNRADKQGTPSALPVTAAASTGRRKSSFLNFFGLGGNVSGKEPPSPSSATNTAVVAAATVATSGPNVEVPVKTTNAVSGNRPQSAGKKKGSHKQHRSPPKAGKSNGQGNEWAIEGSPEPHSHAVATAAVSGGSELTGSPAVPTAMSSTDAPPTMIAPSGSETQGLGHGREITTSRKHSRKPSRVVLPPLKQQQTQQQPSLLNEPMPKSLDVAATAAADTVASGGGRQRSQSIVEASSSSPSQKRHRSKSEKSPLIGLGTAPSTKTSSKMTSMSEKTKTTATTNSSGLNQSGKVAPDS